MFETLRPARERSYVQPQPANIPKTSPVPPVNVGVQSAQEVNLALRTRQERVSENIEWFYDNDIVPPSTQSHILRSLKMFLYSFYLWNAVIFFVAFMVPLRLEIPYGGLDVRDFVDNLNWTRILIMVLASLILGVRALALTWSYDFYNYAIVLGMMEAGIAGGVALWWSPGLPLLLALIFFGVINLVVSQWYYAGFFALIVMQMADRIAKCTNMDDDHTEETLQAGSKITMNEFWRFMGVKDNKPEDMYDERCGVYANVDHPEHIEALQKCYDQAIHPASAIAEWERDGDELASLGALNYVDGIVHALSWFVTSGLAGLWLGQCAFRTEFHTAYALAVTALLLLVRVLSFLCTSRWLMRALGIAVAEKEWLSYDITWHAGERDQGNLHPVAISAEEGGNGPWFMGQFAVDGGVVERGFGGGRLNLTFMWLCAFAVSEFVGASMIAKICSNVASETRFMFADLTAYEFKKLWAARWEVTITTILLQIVQMLLFLWTIALYFGTYFDGEVRPPAALIFVLGLIGLASAALRTAEALQFASRMLWQEKDPNGLGPRNMWTSETVMLAISLLFLVVVLLVAYLVPIALETDFILGKCETAYRSVFPSACALAAPPSFERESASFSLAANGR
mmetsp:Transcript_79598/g.170683  ORF Transcript_79598/g.170683 Transcript_79598/m.170683 type:complete len:627 (-) Transcript_79598:56-1936(-)